MVLKGGEWREHWPTVLSGTIGLSLATLYTYSMGAFLGPIQRDLGWSRTQISLGLMIATTCAAIVGPFVGAAVDRFGSRKLAVPGVVIYCVSLALLSQASSPICWWLQWGLIGIASAGVKPTIWVSAVSSLFVKHRGLALALTLSGAALGSVFVPLLSIKLIAVAGWRMAYVYLALLWGGIAFALVLPFFKGAIDKQRAVSATISPLVLDGMALREALLSRRYFFIFSASMICALVQMAFVISLIPMLSDWGFSRTTAASIAATVGITSITGRLVSGMLMDRWDPRIISSISVSVPAGTAILLLISHSSIVVVIGAVLILGVSVGAELEAATYLTVRYFGLRHFGFLFGIILSGLAVATGFGPLLASVVFDYTGSYDMLLWAAVPLSFCAGAMIAGLGKHVHPVAKPSGLQH